MMGTHLSTSPNADVNVMERAADELRRLGSVKLASELSVSAVHVRRMEAVLDGLVADAMDNATATDLAVEAGVIVYLADYMPARLRGVL